MKTKLSVVAVGVLAVLMFATTTYSSQDTSLVSKVLGNKDFQEKVFSFKDNYVAGNPDAKAVIIDIFDYNCSDCRAIAPTLEELSSANKDVKVAYVDFPKLGEMSAYSARAAIAAMSINKYPEVHHALISANVKLASKEQILDIIKGTGIDMKALETAMNTPAVNDIMLNNMLTGAKMCLIYVPTVIIGNSKAPHDPTVLAEPTPQEIKDTLQKYLK